jgi:hypothetical protein
MAEPRIVVASQPRYLPSCSYVQRLLVADVVVYLDTVQYTPRDWENRNRVKAPAGPVWLTVPVVHARRGQRIVDTAIDGAQDWVRRHLRTLELNYRRAPCFDEVFPVVRAVLERPWERLADLDIGLADALLGYLGRRASWVRASTLPPEEATGQDLLIALTRRVGGTLYLSGPLGRDYIDPARFRAARLGLAFHDYAPVAYPQLHGPFVPNLSVVDLLFNCGRAGLGVILAGGPARAALLERLPEAV